MVSRAEGLNQDGDEVERRGNPRDHEYVQACRGQPVLFLRFRGPMTGDCLSRAVVSRARGLNHDKSTD